MSEASQDNDVDMLDNDDDSNDSDSELSDDASKKSQDDSSNNDGSDSASSDSSTPDTPMCEESESESESLSSSCGPLPDEEDFDDELLLQRPLDIRMFIFDTEMVREPLSPAEHSKVDDNGTGDGDPWHAFELPLFGTETYEQCFSTPSSSPSSSRPHYAQVLQRAIGNLTHVDKTGGTIKVMSCGTDEAQKSLSKYIKLIVRYKTRKFFCVKAEDHRSDCTVMHIPMRAVESLKAVVPELEASTGALVFFCDGPDVEVRDAKDRWKRGRIERWLSKDSVSVKVGRSTAEVLISDVRSIKRGSKDRIPVAVFSLDDKKRLLCVAHMLRHMADARGRISILTRMFHPMISAREYPPEQVALCTTFELPLKASTNCSIIVSTIHNIVIIVGTAAEKQLCATYIQCMNDTEIPSRADALLMLRPPSDYCHHVADTLEHALILIGQTTKTCIFIKQDKVVVMSPSFLRRAHAFLLVAQLAAQCEETVGPMPNGGYVNQLHFPIDSGGLHKVTVIDPRYKDQVAHRRSIYESKMEHMALSTGGAVAIMQGSIYAIGTEESQRNIIQYTKWFFMDPMSMGRDRTGPGGKDALCVSVDACIDVPHSFFTLLAQYFKVYAIPYPGMEKSHHVQNIWLVGPNRALTSAAAALRWYVENDPDAVRGVQTSLYPHKTKRPTIHTAPAPLSQPPDKSESSAAPPPAPFTPMMPYFMPPAPYVHPMMGNPFMAAYAMEAQRRCL